MIDKHWLIWNKSKINNSNIYIDLHLDKININESNKFIYLINNIKFSNNINKSEILSFSLSINDNDFNETFSYNLENANYTYDKSSIRNLQQFIIDKTDELSFNVISSNNTNNYNIISNVVIDNEIDRNKQNININLELFADLNIDDVSGNKVFVNSLNIISIYSDFDFKYRIYFNFNQSSLIPKYYSQILQSYCYDDINSFDNIEINDYIEIESLKNIQEFINIKIANEYIALEDKFNIGEVSLANQEELDNIPTNDEVYADIYISKFVRDNTDIYNLIKIEVMGTTDDPDSFDFSIQNNNIMYFDYYVDNENNKIIYKYSCDYTTEININSINNINIEKSNSTLEYNIINAIPVIASKNSLLNNLNNINNDILENNPNLNVLNIEELNYYNENNVTFWTETFIDDDIKQELGESEIMSIVSDPNKFEYMLYVYTDVDSFIENNNTFVIGNLSNYINDRNDIETGIIINSIININTLDYDLENTLLFLGGLSWNVTDEVRAPFIVNIGNINDVINYFSTVDPEEILYKINMRNLRIFISDELYNRLMEISQQRNIDNMLFNEHIFTYNRFMEIAGYFA